MSTLGTIYGVNGPVIKVAGSRDFKMAEMVEVGEEKLTGECIALDEDYTIVQVYENTTGLKPGEQVTGLGYPLSATLGPGIIGNIFDGIERPLLKIEESAGAFIKRGINIPSLDEEKKWDVKFILGVGSAVSGGTIIAETVETPLITHKIMIPPHISGTITWVAGDGAYSINECIAKVGDNEITLCQKWPIRIQRPINNRYEIKVPLITGQRIIDSLFPIAKGGAAAIPGGFGTGKTMSQHQIAKWSDADIIIYIGCGERGNEMTQVLEEFSELVDPKSGRLLLDRTVLIANTSNMPVAAREASIYTGITLAEYYRDMGYHVAIMADSTSRWAEALREISGRLEEMPAEEGFPAYLASRLSGFYERAGFVNNLNGTEGSITIIGAVSPTGGDLSEPVTQNTKRFVRCFWALDRSLAYARHYPAIDWNSSYSEYTDDLSEWYRVNVGSQFVADRIKARAILAEENKLMEIVKLVGSDVLPDDQRLTLEIARVIRLGFLQQNAYNARDTFVPLEKQAKMMDIILYLNARCAELVKLSMPISLMKADGIFEKVISIKYDVSNDNLNELDEYKLAIDEFYNKIINSNG